MDFAAPACLDSDLRPLLCIVALLAAAGVALAQPVPTPPDPTPPEPTAPEPLPVPTPEPPPEPPAPPASIAVETAPPPEEPELTDEQREALANYEPSAVRVGGFLQARYTKQQDSDVAGDEDGFALARARLSAIANTRAGNLDLSANVEGDLLPAFRLLDAFATVSRYWKGGHTQLAMQVGQMRVPLSRQQLLPESMLSFIDKAQLAALVPERDIGLQVSASLAGLIRFTGGAFNGEGENQPGNANQRYLWAGRVEISPLARSVLSESMFGGRFLTLGVSFGTNRLSEGPRRDEIGYLGFDIAGAHRGVSASAEYLRATTKYTTVDSSPAPNDFKGSGFTLQAAYLVPKRLPPYRQSRLELAARLQQLEPNNNVPVLAPGDPTQKVRTFTAVASLYVRAHAMKAQLAYSKVSEIDDVTADDRDATYDNDQLVLQLTYQLD